MAKKTINKEQIESSAFTYIKVIDNNMRLNMLKNTGLSVSSITNLIKLKAEFKALIGEYNSAVEALMSEKWGLTKETNGGYTYINHEKRVDIEKDVIALKNTPVELKSKLSFLTMKELQTAGEGLDINLISDLYELLVIKD